VREALTANDIAVVGAFADPARPAPLLDATDDPQAVQLKG
jgi:hypothetical protein